MPLSQTELRHICRLLIDDVNLALIHRNVQIAVDDTVVDWLLKKAEEESNSGARPLRRAIQRHGGCRCAPHLRICLIRCRDVHAGCHIN